jgi:hypothetical protein
MLTQLKQEDGIWKSAAYHSSKVWDLEWESKPTTSDIIERVKELASTKEHKEYVAAAIKKVEGVR